MSIRNTVTLIGNVGQIPTVKTLPSGNRVIELSFATNETYRNREGNKITRTEWHSIKAYGDKLVEVLERYVTKGTKLAVVGSLRYGKWVDKYEQTRSTTDIILEEFTFLGSKERDSAYSTEEADQADMMVAEPTPDKTAKRRNGKAKKKAAATTEMAAAEDLPF